MTDTIRIEKLNEVYMQVFADRSVLQELTEFFSFRPNGYQFSPKFKAKVWDGYIRMISPFRPVLLIGLFEELKMFCETREYTLEYGKEFEYETNVPDDFGYQIAEELGTELVPWPSQNEYIVNAIRERRALSLSPTSSGKSFIMYLLGQHYIRSFQHRVLIIVPTIALLRQMKGDFIEYGCPEKDISMIEGGVDKNPTTQIVISTWQSLQNLPTEWFDPFGVVMGDEAHLFTGKSLQGIMEKCEHAKYRFGFTGTISSDSKTHKMVLSGLFGKIRRFITTSEMIQSGRAAKFKVKGLVLNHSDESKKQFQIGLKQIAKNKKNKGGSKKYVAEREYLINHTKRNIFIRNLLWSLEGQNNLVLFELVEKHGKVLEPLLRKEGRHLHFLHGNVSGDDRERIRHQVENDPIKNHDILASYGVFSTGINLKRLDNLIFASGSKGEIRVLQSIGRMLRKGNGSDDTTLYDITDDLSHGSFENYTLEHFKKRIEIYASEQFPFKIFNIDLK